MERRQDLPVQEVNWQQVMQQAMLDGWQRRWTDRLGDVLHRRTTLMTRVTDETGWGHEAKLVVRQQENGQYVGRFRYYYRSGIQISESERQEEIIFHSATHPITGEYGTQASVSVATDTKAMYDQITAVLPHME